MGEKQRSAGEKLQTVRRQRNRNPIVTGTVLQLYTGQRTKNARKLGDAIFTGTEAVEIDRGMLFCGGRYLLADEREAFAKADGFEDYDRMTAWFASRAGLPFEGRVIRWRRRKQAKKQRTDHD